MNGDRNGEEKRLRILVVDDESKICDVVQSFLENEGYEVMTADSGVSALSALEDDEVQIMLLDIRMPDMDGLQCLRSVKDMYPDIEIVMMSGFATLKMAKMSLKIGALDYLCKPLSFPHLKDVIRQIEVSKFLEYM